MDANELRINNLVQNKHGIIHTILLLNLEKGGDVKIRAWQSKNKYYGMSDDLIQPVPLTEEWLIKFGFTLYDADVHPNDREYFFEDMDLTMNVEENSYYCINVPSWAIDLKYVHQLQNLYFALTGKELALIEK